MPRQFRPAINRDLAILRIKPNDNLSGEGATGITQKAGVFNRRRTDDDVADAAIQNPLDGIEITDTATQLDGNFAIKRLDNFANRPFILLSSGSYLC